ncbi:4-hydroxyphenylpyruvate dioxygenase [Oceanimonas doudoroffii]|uniref:4-hydroxyphenylpyruvate dioxygenase n=1 Tax=Oceanimonas doudoroffii TaxID=84158 RepID=G5CZF5_9GAMM|nr:4-hydroxyphenylpyruvate dioxygenase [Oceanimonas doudoroffii]AEQ39110.1 4-hydroxyphenylpyruvate dioxygenase [Oceanimonas doudoroffii]OXY83451.1 4-hydroxyphenylpyruvate dioxygenase [Oceanimonas doudoroffii]
MAESSNHLWENPLGTDGFEFVEYASTEPERLAQLFEHLGFVAVSRHRSKNVTLYRQGDINFILNAEPDSQAAQFAKSHGPCANAMAFRVKDAAVALKRLQADGAKVVPSGAGPMELQIPAIEGIGGSLIYLVDRYGDHSIYDVDFRPLGGVARHPKGVGLTYIDHLTHNVARGHMDLWAGFYQRLFNFREIRYFDIEGKLTGLRSRAMTSPCGKIRIPINESSDEHSQIEEFLRQYRGEGIQHIALGTDDIYRTVEQLRAGGMSFMDTPDTYYERLNERLPGHNEDLGRLQHNRILMDGAPTEGQGLLLQIFTDTVIGPIFFEIIQRKGNEGFGEGNFQALFESIEEDQIRRGVLKAE